MQLICQETLCKKPAHHRLFPTKQKRLPCFRLKQSMKTSWIKVTPQIQDTENYNKGHIKIIHVSCQQTPKNPLNAIFIIWETSYKVNRYM